MAPTLEAMRRRRESARDLYSVVRVMKTLAAANIRQCEKGVESLRDYARTVEEGLQIVLRQHPERLSREPVFSRRWCVVVFGSDQGMCGSFNEQIAHYAIEQMKALTDNPSDITTLAVGIRVAGRLEDAGYHVEADLHVPSTVSNITTRVDDLLLKIEEFRHQRGHNQFLLIYNRPSPPASFYPIRRQLLPVDFEWLHSLARKKWDSPSLPVMTMDWSEMFSSLIRQHLFVSLFRAFAESIASENSSRLASMQVAEKNIESHLSRLNMQYHQNRQQAITEELLDIIAGFETLTNDGR